MTMQFDFEGIDELIREIDKIEGMTNELKDEALIEGADILKERMRQEVYANGLQRRSGTAQESIDRTNPKNSEILVGNTGKGYYLYFHEEGFYNVWAKRFISPRPFASIAYENSKNDILNAYVDVFRKGLGMK